MVGLILCLVAVCFLIIGWDCYIYYFKKPPYTMESVEKRIDDLYAEIEDNKGSDNYPFQTTLDIIEFWEMELSRIKRWNIHHPDETV